MKKRGQLTIFLLLIVIILIMLSLVLFIQGIVKKQEMVRGVNDAVSGGLDTSVVKGYIEDCAAQIAEDVLFDEIGLRGGYVNLNGVDYTDFDYGDAIGGDQGDVVYHVPYYLIGAEEHKPEIDVIEGNIADRIKSEAGVCLDSGVFKELDYDVVPEGNIDIEASANEDDVSIAIAYPLRIEKGRQAARISRFRIALPVRLRLVYGISSKITGDVKAHGQDEGQPYSLDSNCDSYSSSSVFQDGVLIKIKRVEHEGDVLVRILDYDAYLNDIFVEHFHKPFIFQFALKDAYTNGECYW